MATLNKISLIGYLGKDPEVRYTPDGTAVTSFSIAINEKVKDEERTYWFKVTTWNKLAETCGKYLAKGKQVYVEGKFGISEWKDKEGKNRYTLEVTANQIVLLGKSEGNGNIFEEKEEKPLKKSSEKPAENAEKPDSVIAVEKDDIPF